MIAPITTILVVAAILNRIKRRCQEMNMEIEEIYSKSLTSNPTS